MKPDERQSTIAMEVMMIDCTGSTIACDDPRGLPSGEEDLRGIARYLGLAVAGEAITIAAAADALVQWTDADSHALESAAARSEAGSLAESVLKIAASAPPRAA
jgi:hypothetical protein